MFANVGQLFSQEVGRILMRAGIAPHISGFAMLGVAAQLVADDGMRYRKVVDDLYPAVARVFGTTASGVERNIRTAIAKAWESGALRRFYEDVGMYHERRPTNAAFIAQIAFEYTNSKAEKREQVTAARG